MVPWRLLLVSAPKFHEYSNAGKDIKQFKILICNFEYVFLVQFVTIEQSYMEKKDSP